MTQSIEIWTVRDVLSWTAQRFSALELPTPLLDAQLLIGFVLSLSKVQIYTQLDRPLIESERAQLRELVRRRLCGEPVAYLLNQKDWHDLELFVDKRVLVPRPETETLLDLILAVCRHESWQPRKILDLCTGSGCLAIALAKAYPAARVMAVDISADALEVARINCERHGVSNVELILADVLAPETKIQLSSMGPFNIIVSNPPYVSEAEWTACDGSVRHFEPKVALVGGEQGWMMPAVLLEALSTSGLLEQADVLGFELGLSHPEILARELGQKLALPFSEPLKVLACQRPVWEFPRDALFAVKDYTQRSRYLFAARSKAH